VGEGGTQESVSASSQEDPKQNTPATKNRTSKIGGGKDGKIGKRSAPGRLGIRKPAVTKSRKVQEGSDKSDKSDLTRSAGGDTTDEEAMDTNITISQQDLHCLLQPMKDPNLLQQPTYVGPLTAILDRLGIDRKAYQAAIDNKDQSFFSGLKIYEDRVDDVLPQVGSGQEE